MSIGDSLDDIRDQISELEDRICDVESASDFGWPDAAPWVAFWAMIAVVASVGTWTAAYGPIRPDSSVECIKAGGKWEARACQKASP